MFSHEVGRRPGDFPVVGPVVTGKVLKEATENFLVVGLVGAVKADGLVDNEGIKHFRACFGMCEAILEPFFFGFVLLLLELEFAGHKGRGDNTVGIGIGSKRVCFLTLGGSHDQ